MDDDSPSVTNFIIVTKDNIAIPVPYQIKEMLLLLQEKITSDNNERIHLDFLSSTQLSAIIEYCSHHNYVAPSEIIRPLQFNDLSKCVKDTWDAEYIDRFSFEDVVSLLHCAEGLKCSSLVDLCYAKLAIYFRTTPIGDLKEKFLLTETEFTQNELKEIKDGNEWLMTLVDSKEEGSS